MGYAWLNYFKMLFHCIPQEREYVYFNPEGDFQDIRGFIPMEDDSFVLFMGMVLLGLFLFVGLLRWGYRRSSWYQKRERKALARRHLLRFYDVDAKTYAYVFTKWSGYMVTPSTTELCQLILSNLARYKYVKEKGTLSLREIRAIKHFLKEAK